VPGIPLTPFDVWFERAEAGDNGKGTRKAARRAYDEQGKPPVDLLEEQWQAYLASLGDAHSLHISSWIAERGWEQEWEPWVSPATRITMASMKKFTDRHAQGPKYRDLAPRCGFHSAHSPELKAPAPDPECIACERVAKRETSEPVPRKTALERARLLCTFHQLNTTSGQRAPEPNPECPTCERIWAATRRQTSEEPAPAGDLLSRGEA
jgi:hypothetical protein